MRRRSPASALAVVLLLALGPGSASAQPPPPSDVTPPVVLSHVDAVYPASAVPTSRHLDVVLAVTVDADGNVSRVDVLESGGPAIDEAAKTAVRQWTFRPATKGGKAIAARIKVPFHFAPLAPPQDIAPKPQSEPVVPGNVVGPQSGGQATTGPSPESVGQEAPPPPPTAAVQDIEVHGRTAPPLQGASDFRLRVEELKDIPRANASDVLKLAPGILLTNEGGEGHAEQVFLRGFDAREGQDIEFTVGGVPINESGQPPRQRLRRHALHHPGARPGAARARGALRSAAGQLRRRRQRRLRARPRQARPHGEVHCRLLRHAAGACSPGDRRTRASTPSAAAEIYRPTASARTAARSARRRWPVRGARSASTARGA